jgi:hypothetical protein
MRQAGIGEAARENEGELETVDLEGVEILAAGGPVRGRGSPPEGDYWTIEDLDAIAQAARELEGEIRPPAKIGHGRAGNAVGWLTNIRREGDRLLADIRRVPRRFAELIKAGAYRTRSVELSRVTSQRTGRVYDWVVTGLAWLGDRLPAVQTLEDVVALYEGDDAERRFVQLDERQLGEIDVARLLEALHTLVTLRSDDSRAMAETSESKAEGAGPVEQQAQRAPERELEASELLRRLEAAEERARQAEERAAATADELRLERRARFVEQAIRDGKIAPGQREALERLYDADPEGVQKLVEAAPVNEMLRTEYGSDADLDPESPERKAQEELARAFEQDLARRLGVPVEELI